jgi:hypothetical protein
MYFLECIWKDSRKQVSLSANRQVISFRFAALVNKGAKLPTLDFGLPRQKPNTGLFNHPPHTRPTLSICLLPVSLQERAPSPSPPESRPLPVSLPNLGSCAVGRQAGGRCLQRWRAAALPRLQRLLHSRQQLLRRAGGGQRFLLSCAQVVECSVLTWTTPPLSTR